MRIGSALPQPFKPGYTFVGWFTVQAQSGGVEVTPNTTLPRQNSVTYWARWVVVRNFRPMVHGTLPPNCFGYVIRNNNSQGGPPSNNLTAAGMRTALQNVGFNVRDISGANALIGLHEYRVAFRFWPEQNGFHIIYQLSNGNWASKNHNWQSKQANSSTDMSMWFTTRTNLGIAVVYSGAFPGSNTYFAISRR